eukprot:TRINITY_DN1708_c0_g1_i1.p1 TRINITY_DN1708_c0_g1~~TRINITY_DN1708_c0_g1_i1.p1  ORF type:complete len:206 (-),score=72.26 TRINITY_DN1708_c0_g1_i1:33-650(-)
MHPNYAPQMPPYMQQPMPQPQQPPPQQQRDYPAFHQWLLAAIEGQDYVFMFKLAILVYFFSQGGSTERMIFFSIIAFFIYLYNTGRFRVRLRVARRVEVNPNARPADQPQAQPQQPQQPQPQPQQQPQQQQPQQPQQPPQEPQREEEFVWQPEPINPNESQVVRELKEFFVPLFLSLYPFYQFRPRPQPQPEPEFQPQQPPQEVN